MRSTMHAQKLLKLRSDVDAKVVQVPLDSRERVSENHIKWIAATRRAVRHGSGTVAALTTYNGTEVEDPVAIGKDLTDLRVHA